MATQRPELTVTPSLSSRGLWSWGLSLLLAGTLLVMYGADLAHAVAGVSDRLSQFVADFVVTFARLALAPAGAMITALAVLVRVSRPQ